MRQLGLWGPAAPPQLRNVISTLRALNRAHTDPVAVAITDKGLIGFPDGPRGECQFYGRELLPGGNKSFNAPGAARRLLAALRDLEPTR